MAIRDCFSVISYIRILRTGPLSRTPSSEANPRGHYPMAVLVPASPPFTIWRRARTGVFPAAVFLYTAWYGLAAFRRDGRLLHGDKPGLRLCPRHSDCGHSRRGTGRRCILRGPAPAEPV